MREDLQKLILPDGFDPPRRLVHPDLVGTALGRDDLDDDVARAYLYPLGRRTERREELAHHDVDVSWWVAEAAYEAGYYDRAFEALRRAG